MGPRSGDRGQLGFTPEEIKVAQASMGPRSGDRGQPRRPDEFNAYALSLQWVHDPEIVVNLEGAAGGPGRHLSFNGSTIRRSWSTPLLEPMKISGDFCFNGSTIRRSWSTARVGRCCLIDTSD